MPSANDRRSSSTKRFWLNERCADIDPETLKKHERSVVNPDEATELVQLGVAAAAALAIFVYGIELAGRSEGLAAPAIFFGFSLLAVVVGLSLFTLLVVLGRRGDHRWVTSDLHPEAAAARQAMALSTAIIEEIRTSPAWKSEVFDEHRARIDLNATHSDIVTRTARIDAAAAKLPHDIAQASKNVKAAAAPHVEALTVATDALISRVMTLDNYRTETDHLASLLEELARAEREMKTISKLEALDPSMFDELYRDAGINDWHADQTRSSSGKVAEVQEAVQLQVHALKELSSVASLPFASPRNG
ncbi:hypothetical protein [Rhodococcus rhodochrous]|uniref:hypothetical protein n=1 Tax=Rhodococcus rhodochrous TaxID=1829 RepID=UPI000E76F592